MKLLLGGFTKGFSSFTKEFLGGVWKGMGPDPMKRTIKSPKKEGTVTRKAVREAARKVLSERRR